MVANGKCVCMCACVSLFLAVSASMCVCVCACECLCVNVRVHSMYAAPLCTHDAPRAKSLQSNSACCKGLLTSVSQVGCVCQIHITWGTLFPRFPQSIWTSHHLEPHEDPAAPSVQHLSNIYNIGPTQCAARGLGLGLRFMSPRVTAGPSGSPR